MNPKETANKRDARVARLYEQLVEIEQRLIPTGPHVFGRASELQEKADLLRMVASFDRPEHGVRALTGSPNRRAAEHIHLQRQQSFGRDDRQTALVC